MMLRFLLAGLLVVGTHSFTSAPIRWCGLPARRFVVAPKAAEPGQELTILELPSKTSSNEIPLFTARPDNTIAWHAAGLCLEASGEKSRGRDSIRLNRCNGGPNQLWNFVPLHDGRRNLIQLKDTNTCLESGLPGRLVELRMCTHTERASWEFANFAPVPTAGHITPPPFFSRHMMSLLVLILPVALLSLHINVRSSWWQTKAPPMVMNKGLIPLCADEGGVALTRPMAPCIRTFGIRMQAPPPPPPPPTEPKPKPSDIWEIDFYSRPVQGPDGKKLWELLVTDSTGAFRHVEPVPSNCVNSKELRSRLQRVIDSAEVPPTEIKFFRVQMKNMISIALDELPGIDTKPSRTTYALIDWLVERNRDVYPTMSGYRRQRPTVPPVKMVEQIPDILLGESYAVANLPLAEFLPGGSISQENIGTGKLCPIPRMDVSADQMIGGIIMFSQRSNPLAHWMAGVDLAAVSASVENREISLGVDLNTEYLLAKIRTEDEMNEARELEEGKKSTAGLHFFCIQENAESEQPDGFWLLRDSSFQTMI